MNEQLKKQLELLIKNIDSRKQSEKFLILGLLIAGLIMGYLTLAFDPKRAEISSLQSQIASLEQRQTQTVKSEFIILLKPIIANKEGNTRVLQESNERFREINRAIDPSPTISPGRVESCICSILV